jgi:hypothetical protein
MQQLLVCFDRRFDRMGRMVEAAGGDLVEAVIRRQLTDAEFRAALYTCADCRRETACDRWLGARDGRAEGAAAFFCPNAALFDRLAADT